MTDQQREHLRELNRPYTVRFAWSGSLMDPDGSADMRVMGDQGVYELRERWMSDQPGCIFKGAPVLTYIDPKTGVVVTAPFGVNGMEFRARLGYPYAGIKHTTPEPVPFEQELGTAIFDKSPDVRQFEAFAKHIKEGGKPRTNEMDGLMASVALIAAHEAVTTKQTVEIDPAVYTFDFETPDPFEYERIEV